MNFFQELRRRNIFRVAGLYATVGWVLVQISSTLERTMALPEWFDSVIVALALIGFPFVLVLTWAFEMTPDGFKRTEQLAEGELHETKRSNGLDYAIIGGLLLVCVFITLSHFKGAASKAPASTLALGEERARSIAVLPFEDFSPQGDQSYFAEGISEELLNALAQVSDLKVSSRTSAFSFQKTEASIPEIGKALGVAHVLEGSVRKAGSTLRITAQLIDTQTDQHLWSETYDRALTAENIFAIQDDISKAIVRALSTKMNFAPQERREKTSSAEAYDAFLRGKDHIATRTAASLKSAVSELTRATEIDPDFAAAHAALATAHILSPQYGAETQEDALRSASLHVDRAMDLAPNSADSLIAKGVLLDNSADPRRALSYYERALLSSPNLSEAHRRRGIALTAMARYSEAKSAFEAAATLDPLSPLQLSNLTFALAQHGDLTEFGITARENVRLHPDFAIGQYALGVAQFYEGNFAGAQSTWLALGKDNPIARSGLSELYFKSGLTDRLSLADGGYHPALAALAKGERDRAVGLARSSEAASPYYSGDIFYLSGDMTNAAASARQTISRLGLAAPDAELSPFNVFSVAYMVMALRAQSDPLADIMSAKLSAYYAGKSPTEFEFPESHYAGALWAMIEGRDDEIYPWLDAISARNFPWPELDFDPSFDAVRSTPAFQSRLTQFASVRSKRGAELK